MDQWTEKTLQHIASGDCMCGYVMSMVRVDMFCVYLVWVRDSFCRCPQRKHDERDEKLKHLTANISASIASAKPG